MGKKKKRVGCILVCSDKLIKMIPPDRIQTSIKNANKTADAFLKEI